MIVYYLESRATSPIAISQRWANTHQQGIPLHQDAIPQQHKAVRPPFCGHTKPDITARYPRAETRVGCALQEEREGQGGKERPDALPVATSASQRAVPPQSRRPPHSRATSRGSRGRFPARRGPVWCTWASLPARKRAQGRVYPTPPRTKSLVATPRSRRRALFWRKGVGGAKPPGLAAFRAGSRTPRRWRLAVWTNTCPAFGGGHPAFLPGLWPWPVGLSRPVGPCSGSLVPPPPHPPSLGRPPFGPARA